MKGASDTDVEGKQKHEEMRRGNEGERTMRRTRTNDTTGVPRMQTRAKWTERRKKTEANAPTPRHIRRAALTKRWGGTLYPRVKNGLTWFLLAYDYTQLLCDGPTCNTFCWFAVILAYTSYPCFYLIRSPTDIELEGLGTAANFSNSSGEPTPLRLIPIYLNIS